MKITHAFVALLWMFTVTVEAQTYQFGGNPYSASSLDNPYSTGRSAYSPDSVGNPYGRYGNDYSTTSPQNSYGSGIRVTPTDGMAGSHDAWAKRFRR